MGVLRSVEGSRCRGIEETACECLKMGKCIAVVLVVIITSHGKGVLVTSWYIIVMNSCFLNGFQDQQFRMYVVMSIKMNANTRL